MLGAIPATLYRWFLSALGHWSRSHKHHEPKRPDEAFKSAFGPSPDFATVDSIATRLGEVYRGIGVLCGLLGFCVIVLALLPHATKVANAKGWLEGIKVGEIVLMAAIGLLITYTRASGMKDRWILTRIFAEELRYAPLARFIANAKLAEPAGLRRLQAEVRLLLSDDGNSQLLYHRRKSERYEGIEWLTGVITWAFYGAALSTALVVASMALWDLRHAGRNEDGGPSLTVLVLVGMPAAVAILHGVVAFLRLPQLTSQHDLAVAELQVLRDLMLELSEDDSDRTPWIRLSEQLLEVLTRGDTAWVGIAHHQVIQPV